MSLKVGIVGLPNVGKSTLFNALLKKQQALVASFPFTTIEPNIGVVPVPDERLSEFARVVEESEGLEVPPLKIPVTVEFVDIAGLVSGAHKGEGLGNRFLAHIREVDAVCHVLRVFEDSGVEREGSGDPKDDFEVVETELKLADLQTLEKQKEPKGVVSKEEKQRWVVVSKLRVELQKGAVLREVDLGEDGMKSAKALNLLTLKPVLVVLNVGEQKLKEALGLENEYAQKLGIAEDQVVAISAKLESQLTELPEEEQQEYLSDLGVDRSGLEKLVKKAYSTLGLITFLTTNKSEVRAWTVRKGTTAKVAAGVVHSDFESNFIKADVVSFKDFAEFGGWQSARDKGKVRSEGKDYVVKDGDVIEFKTAV